MHKVERMGPRGIPTVTATHKACEAMATRYVGASKASQWSRRAFYDPEQSQTTVKMKRIGR